MRALIEHREAPVAVTDRQEQHLRRESQPDNARSEHFLRCSITSRNQFRPSEQP